MCIIWLRWHTGDNNSILLWEVWVEWHFFCDAITVRQTTDAHSLFPFGQIDRKWRSNNWKRSAITFHVSLYNCHPALHWSPWAMVPSIKMVRLLPFTTASALHIARHTNSMEKRIQNGLHVLDLRLPPPRQLSWFVFVFLLSVSCGAYVHWHYAYRTNTNANNFTFNLNLFPLHFLLPLFFSLYSICAYSATKRTIDIILMWSVYLTIHLKYRCKQVSGGVYINGISLLATYRIAGTWNWKLLRVCVCACVSHTHTWANNKHGNRIVYIESRFNDVVPWWMMNGDVEGRGCRLYSYLCTRIITVSSELLGGWPHDAAAALYGLYFFFFLIKQPNLFYPIEQRGATAWTTAFRICSRNCRPSSWTPASTSIDTRLWQNTDTNELDIECLLNLIRDGNHSQAIACCLHLFLWKSSAKQLENEEKKKKTKSRKRVQKQ